MGLLSMRERVYFLDGHMNIWSMPGTGTLFCGSGALSLRPETPSGRAAATRIA